MKYVATVSAVFAVEAENIVEARRITKRIRCLGEVAGSRTPNNNRDSVRYSVDKISERVTVSRATRDTTKEGEE